MAIPPGYTGPVKPVIHSMTRRANFIDYTDPGFFMITIRANPRVAVWSVVTGNPYSTDLAYRPRVLLSPSGKILAENIHKIHSLHPDLLDISRSIVMPDHLHFIVYIKKKLDRHLGSYINSMMSASTSKCRKLGLIPADESLFCENYNDRPVRDKGQLERQKRYIEDNPRRWLIKQRFPELFKRIRRLRIGAYDFDGIGNIFLLRKPDIIAVHVRSKWTPAEISEYSKMVLERVRKGAVAVSPFISPHEKAIMNAAIEAGGSLIRINDYSLGYAGKAFGREFELTAEGRMLLLARSDRPHDNRKISYHLAHEMNGYAEWLAGDDDISMSVRTTGGNSGSRP